MNFRSRLMVLTGSEGKAMGPVQFVNRAHCHVRKAIGGR
jgi:hypothetical protein